MYRNEEKRSCVAVAVFAVLILSLLSCSGNRQKDEVTRIATLRGPSAVEMVHLMDSLDRCGNPGIGITVYDEPLQLRKEMITGTADFAILPTTMGALLYNKGTDYRIAAVPIWGSLFLCGTDTSVRSISDLRGRKVHIMARGMTPDILLQHLLKKNGLEPDKDVELDYRFPTHIDLANAAMAGRTEFCVLSEPYLSQALRVNGKLGILLDLEDEWRRTEGMPLAETAFLCKGALSGSAAVRTVVDAFRSSAQWAVMHPDSASVLAAKYGINPDTAAVRASIPRSGFEVRAASEVETEIKYYLSVILQASPEAIGGRMPDEEFYVR